MIIKKAFGYLLKVETTIKVEEVKSTDKGKKRFLKELVIAFDNDPAALYSIILSNFIDFYCGDYREEIVPILGKLEDEKLVILRVAQKCTPEASRYFSGLFDKNPTNKILPGDQEEDLAWEKKLEAENVFEELMGKLCRFVPVHASFNALPRERITPYIELDKPTSKKARLEREYAFGDQEPFRGNFSRQYLKRRTK